MKKIIEWIKKTGLTNLAYAGGFIAAWIFGLEMIAGACAGIFLYVNINTIRKLIFKKSRI